MGFKTLNLGPFAEIAIPTSVPYIADGTDPAIALGVFCGNAFPKPDGKHYVYTMRAS